MWEGGIMKQIYEDLVEGDKPHSCELCKKKFALACNLRAHMKTHEGDPQEECTNCGKMYLCTGASPPEGVCGACRGGGDVDSPEGDGDTPPHRRHLDEEEETCSVGDGQHTDEEN